MPLPHFGSSYIPVNINNSDFKVKIINDGIPIINREYFNNHICAINNDTIEIKLCTYHDVLHPLIMISNFDNKIFDIEIEIQNEECSNIGILIIRDCKISYDFSQLLDFNIAYKNELKEKKDTFVVNYTYSKILYRSN